MRADISQGVPVVLVAGGDMAIRLLVRESLAQTGLRGVVAENGKESRGALLRCKGPEFKDRSD